MIEAIDVTIYASAYRGAFMVIFNRLAGALMKRWPSFRPGFHPALFPVYLASLDYFEDLLQVIDLAPMMAVAPSWLCAASLLCRALQLIQWPDNLSSRALAQVTATVSFNDAWSASAEAPEAWLVLVQIASVVNIAKWAAVKIGIISLLASCAAVLFYEANRLALKSP